MPSFGSLSLLLILLVLIPNSSRFLRDSDTGWHIRTGELILKERAVPHHDPFSHTMTGSEWFAWEWLTDVGMAEVHAWRGLGGIVASAFLILLISYVVLYRMMVWRGAGPFVACSMTLFCALACVVHWLARPHLVSIALIALWYGMVEGFRRNRTRWIWAAPLLIALWANLHGAFFITFPILGVYAVGEWLEFASRGRWWDDEVRRVLTTYGAVTALSGMASIATPYHFKLYGHLWRYLTDSKLLASIQEFGSPNFHHTDGKLIEILLLLGAVAAGNAIRQKRFVETGLLVLWGHLTLQSERHVTLAAVMLTPIIAEQLTRLLDEVGDKIAHAELLLSKLFRRVRSWYREMMTIQRQMNDSVIYAAAAVFVVAAMSSGWGDKILSPQFDKKRHPVEAVDFIQQSPPSGPMYSSDQFGGYLIYRLYPKIKVFVDGRSDFYRQGRVLQDADELATVGPEWQKLLDQYRIQWMVLERDEPLALIAQMSGQWTSIYEDKTAQILTRKNPPATQAVTGEAKSEP